ncbi:SDR family NAD(P)-dependent oxidoreductase [Nocardia vaccinii]|uniref:SDR family NAD(P)-dependent oxidoreductase n=1 Tax=Nocardia vaccinii TaxID=1822 RepID=UPI00082EF5A5|nr:SDR family oxidoreductase [Nocardia vaccinii]
MRIAESLAVVTGASSGIGAATAERLAREGARVVLVARRKTRIDTVVDDIVQGGGVAAGIAADLTVVEDVDRVADYVLTNFGVPDIVINNAGAGRFLSIDETTAEQAVQMMAAPYFAAFFTTRAFISQMLARGTGTILMVNTPVSVMPWPGAVGYASARYALRGFTESLRQDLRGTGIHVSSVTPTKVHSDYFVNNPGSEDRIPGIEAIVGSTTPDRVAAVICRALATNATDVHTPWRWRLVQPLARAFPQPFHWLAAATAPSPNKETAQ